MVFTRILVTHARRITYMPYVKLTLCYCCVSWCVHISQNTLLRVLAGIVVAIVRHIRRITYLVHTKADANIMLFCATWYANKVNVWGAHCTQPKMLSC